MSEPGALWGWDDYCKAKSPKSPGIEKKNPEELIKASSMTIGS